MSPIGLIQIKNRRSCNINYEWGIYDEEEDIIYKDDDNHNHNNMLDDNIAVKIDSQLIENSNDKITIIIVGNEKNLLTILGEIIVNFLHKKYTFNYIFENINFVNKNKECVYTKLKNIISDILVLG